MRTYGIWVFLILFAQLPGCAIAQTGKCKPSEKNRPECVKELKDEELKAQSEARRRAQLRNRERIHASPPIPPPVQQRQASPLPSVPANPVAPPVTTSCDAGGCWDNNANRYNGGAGNVYLDRAGKTCHRVGVTMQCF